MFKIGEFARIAYISAKLLRHYDQIGLFKPAYVDVANGYRFYEVEQLAELNRIIALKELGFSLEQTKRLMADQISLDEIRGMLIMRKAQIEQALEQETTRLRHVETRLYQIEQEGHLLHEYDVVVKPVAAQKVLTTRQAFPNFASVVQLFRQWAQPQRLTQLGPMIAITHSAEFDQESPVDIEMGFVLKNADTAPITALDGVPVTLHELSGHAMMASVIETKNQVNHLINGAIGMWLENNDYQIAGPWREIYHELSPHLTLEHQVPIQRRST